MSNQDLFQLVVPPERLHPYFKAVLGNEQHYSARLMMNEVFKDFRDKDGNFVQQFQSTAFDARLWELYLFAVLHRSGYQIDWTYDRPDFIATKGNVTACIEAVTTNPSPWGDKEPTLADLARQAGGSKETFIHLLNEYREKYAVRLGTALKAKLGKKYWDLPQAQGLPIVLAIQAFHDDGPLRLGDSALMEFLYGQRAKHHFDESGRLIVEAEPFAEHVVKDRRLQAGFFFGSDYAPEAENISAVLFCNAGTVPKFDRMGLQAGFRSQRLIRMVRVGHCYDHDPDAAEPMGFSYTVGGPQHTETWGEGISIIHNPKARIPLPESFFEGVAQSRLGDDGLVVASNPDFHPFNSLTHIIMIEDKPTESSR